MVVGAKKIKDILSVCFVTVIPSFTKERNPKFLIFYI